MEAGKLPDGWEAARDDQGRQYYFHHPSKTSQWDYPAPVIQVPPPYGGGKGGKGKGAGKGSDMRYDNRPRPY